MSTRIRRTEASATTHASSGGRLVSLQGTELPLRSVELNARARAGAARTLLTQTFANTHPEPLEAVYVLPLPAEGAVAGYSIRVGDKVIRGIVEKREAARDIYERAMVEGRTAGLVEQERVNLFTQRVGNIPPGAVVVVEITVDQRLAWIEGGSWEWRFPTVVAPRYLGVEGRVGDADSVTIDVADAPRPVRATATLHIGDRLRTAGASGPALPGSPSHGIEFAGEVVSLVGESVRLDRDIVVRWPVAGAGEGISLVTARPEGPAKHAYGLLTVVPPEVRPPSLPRDLIVLIDTSGSMNGQPIRRAQEIVDALIDTLGEADRLELIAFDMSPRRWRSGAVAGSADNRREARAWVEALRPGGGTEMTSAMLEALRPLAPDAVRQVVLVTDGLIGFETEVIRSVLNGLPAGSRLHTVGVGSAANRALTRPAARAGRGVEVLAGLDDRAGDALQRLIAATATPVIVDLEITGDAVVDIAPRRPADLMAGAPVLIGLKLSPEGGTLVARGRTAEGPWMRTLTIPPTRPGEGDDLVATLYGREAVEDLETDLAGGARRDIVDGKVERLGLDLGFATRLTAWVAVGEEPTVDPLRPARRTRIPQELPYGMSAEGLGLRETGYDEMMCELNSMSRSVSYSLTRERIEQIESKALRKLRHPSRFRRLGAFLEDTYLGKGRWAARLEGRWRYLELEVEGGAMAWWPGNDLEVVLISHSGRSRAVSCDLARSTEPGMLEAGSIVRLLLEVDEEMVTNAATVQVVLHARRLTIDL